MQDCAELLGDLQGCNYRFEILNSVAPIKDVLGLLILVAGVWSVLAFLAITNPQNQIFVLWELS